MKDNTIIFAHKMLTQKLVFSTNLIRFAASLLTSGSFYSYSNLIGGPGEKAKITQNPAIDVAGFLFTPIYRTGGDQGCYGELANRYFLIT